MGRIQKALIICKIFFFNILFFIISFSFLMSQSYTQSGGTASKTNQTYTANNTDESGILVQNSGIFTLTYSTVKTTGNTSSSDNSSFYGLNAGVLAKSNGKITMNNCSVTTSGSGANGIFAYGTGNISLANDTIKCTGQYAHAIMASGGGTLSAINVIMNTAGANSGAIATDRGSGTITVTGGSVITSGRDSPGIYSTGVINVSDATITSTGSEAAVIEGLNNVTLNNVKLSGGVASYGAVMILQSMSGDAATGTGNFNITGGSLTATSGPAFFVTNTNAAIKLKGVNLDITSGVLLNVAGTSRWGTSGKNGGVVDLVADELSMTGNITLDNISAITATLKNNSTLTGAINTANSSGTLSISFDASSRWIVTGKSFVSILNNADGISGTSVTNIIGNGNNVFYNSNLSANSYLGGKTYSLVGGGELKPLTANGIEQSDKSIPSEYILNQNYPNPFNPSTNISFSLSRASNISLDIFNVNGQLVRSLADHEQRDAGFYSLQWDGKDNYGTTVPSGIYFYKLTTKNFGMSKKMIMLR